MFFCVAKTSNLIGVLFILEGVYWDEEKINSTNGVMECYFVLKEQLQQKAIKIFYSENQLVTVSGSVQESWDF